MVRLLLSPQRGLDYSRATDFGHIFLYKDHKNLTFENFTTGIALRWRLMLEEYGPEIKYIKGSDNDAEDPLSRLPLLNSDVTESDTTRKNLSESYCVDKLDSDTFPLKD